ncbi:GRAM domain-containing protein [Mangrovibacillus cuniculi]|uniref:GRAM domain-containing protein n=1 Tax=Mangrovibacillus cuniculi TaxID=2593652 RepID=A0A7S8HFI5_9BACI|nr:GRAM domain-containing protein [Mangrovibacillus cuniculi]QPC46777.1 hypothetical protein G8O30_07270 [Mangrovibacillus cuniculi]
MKETAVYDGLANVFKGKEAVGGKLYLTNDALIHKAHAANVQKEDVVIPLSEITGVTPKKSFMVLPNRLVVHTKDGQDFVFVVYKRDVWMEKLTNKLVVS